MEAQLPPAIFVIYGITGDLARHKLLPSLYDLAAADKLPETFKIVGVTRRGITVEEVISSIESSVNAMGKQCESAVLKRLESAIKIIRMDITAESEYKHLKTILDELETEAGVCLNRLFYLAIPPQMFIPIVRLLASSELNSGCQHNRAESRLLIEKPLGYDLDSATELIDVITHSFDESQVYLIDHYLAKPAAVNLQKFRFDRGELEKLWSAKHISDVSIIVSEAKGIEGRAVFYEQMGALRDFMQNHLLQLLALVAMEPADSLSTKAFHESKQNLLRAVRAPVEDKMSDLTVRGQYAGYAQEVKNPGSKVETFAAAVFRIENKRWQGVPFLLASGKKLKRKLGQVVVNFKQGERLKSVVIEIDPNPTIKIDGQVAVSSKNIEDAYEVVIAAAMSGNQAIFASSGEVLACWQAVMPILKAWEADQIPLKIYEPGSAGPAEFVKLGKGLK